MRRLRLSRPAQTDLRRILAASLERWGHDGRRSYALTIAGGLSLIAKNPEDPITRDRKDLLPQVRSLHLRLVPRRSRPTNRPVHVVFFRASDTVVEILRILHERMDPEAHIRR